MDFELWMEPKVALAVVLLLIIAQTVYKRFRTTGRPPVVSYVVPWVGSAIELGKSPDAFFKRVIAEYGDIFTVKALGRSITYVTSPQLIAEVYKNPQQYNFSQIHMSMCTQIFMISSEVVHAPVMCEIFYPMNKRLLSPKYIQPVVDRCIALTYQHLEDRADRYDGMNVPLLDFIVPLAFDAAGHAFFGKDCPLRDLFKAFKLFDDNFHLFLAGLPKMFMRGPVAALDDLATIVEEKYFSKPGAMDDASDVVKEWERIPREAGFKTREIARLLVSFLWAIQANSPLVAYWVIVLNLQRPGGLKPLAAEIDEAVASWNSTNPSLPLDSQQNVVDFINQADLPLLNSTVQETLRCASSSMSIRVVTEATELGGYTFSPGDQVVCATRVVHLDSAVHERPDEYVPTRYMTTKKFTKDGKSVANHTMPFGGGVSICQGRYFAQKELKALLALLLMKYTIEADPKSTERPSFCEERMGVGIMQPRGDMRIVIRRREGC